MLPIFVATKEKLWRERSSTASVLNVRMWWEDSDPYGVLGLENGPEASEEEIRKVCFALKGMPEATSSPSGRSGSFGRFF